MRSVFDVYIGAQGRPSIELTLPSPPYEILDALERVGPERLNDVLSLARGRVGFEYLDHHPGLFIGDCYVEYPSKEVQPVYLGQGSPLPEDTDWSVKVKIASDAVPEGVWLRLPGWETSSIYFYVFHISG